MKFGIEATVTERPKNCRPARFLYIFDGHTGMFEADLPSMQCAADLIYRLPEVVTEQIICIYRIPAGKPFFYQYNPDTARAELDSEGED
jgi:hypothetical protein